MNLVEVTELIEHPELDEEMREFYTRKRDELVDAINEDLRMRGLGPLPLDVLLYLARNYDLKEPTKCN